jgi:hypothetical protein
VLLSVALLVNSRTPTLKKCKFTFKNIKVCSKKPIKLCKSAVSRVKACEKKCHIVKKTIKKQCVEKWGKLQYACNLSCTSTKRFSHRQCVAIKKRKCTAGKCKFVTVAYHSCRNIYKNKKKCVKRCEHFQEYLGQSCKDIVTHHKSCKDYCKYVLKLGKKKCWFKPNCKIEKKKVLVSCPKPAPLCPAKRKALQSELFTIRYSINVLVTHTTQIKKKHTLVKEVFVVTNYLLEKVEDSCPFIKLVTTKKQLKKQANVYGKKSLVEKENYVVQL